ncbi:MAG: ADP-ribosylation factor-like protein [Candidatus Thorarchaeota archaeon]
MKQYAPYDIKIFVTGPFQSGKTKLIHAVDPAAISIERPLPRPHRGETGTTTTGFDLGRVIWWRESHGETGIVIPRAEITSDMETNGILKHVELRGVPGMLHFKFVRDTMRVNTDIVLLVVDSSDKEIVEEAIAHLKEARAAFSGKTIVVIANKQDRDDAASPDEVAAWLGVERAIGMSTLDHQACRRVVAEILSAHASSTQN